MKVLLSTPPGETNQRWPPLGLLYIAASVRARSNDRIEVVDAHCENFNKETLVKRVSIESPDVFGMNCSTHTFLSAIDALADIRKVLPETVLVMGGMHATFAAERILREYPLVDFIIKGEAESAFPRFLEHIELGTKPSDVEGISFIDDGVHVNRPHALIEDLDSLPFPARDLVQSVDYGLVYNNIRLTFGKFTTISSSRGCPFECAFCSCATFSQRRFRARSPENVVNELETLYSQGYDLCVFVDDTFTLDRRRVERICELIRSRRIKMQLHCEGRVDSAPYSLLRKMKLAGFDVIYFGVESASQHVLDYYRKSITPEQAVKAVGNAKKAGLMAVTSFIFGAPVESRGDILNTVDFMKTVRPHGVQVNILDCLIGTTIWDDFVRDGVVGPQDWKTNHPIHEYCENGLTQAELEHLRRMAYAAHRDAWNGAWLEFPKILLENRTLRRVILGNFLNRHALRWALDGVRTAGDRGAQRQVSASSQDDRLTHHNPP